MPYVANYQRQAWLFVGDTSYDRILQLGVAIHSFAFCLLSLALSMKLQLPFCCSHTRSAFFASSHERYYVNSKSLLP